MFDSFCFPEKADVQDEVDEDEAPGEDAIKPETLCHIVENVETGVFLTKELGAELEKAEKCTGPKEVTPDIELTPPEDSDDCEDEPPAAKTARKEGVARTLHEVLERAGLADFKKEKEDTEAKVLDRVRWMCPHMQTFTALVRHKEGIISLASILKAKPCSTQHNQNEHDLAVARAEYHCSSQRQSRFALWTEYIDRVVDVFEDVENADDAKSPLKRVTTFKPNGGVNHAGRRVAQVLVLRPFMSGGELGPLRLGLLTCAFRGGKKGKQSKQFPWTHGNLPIHATTCVHCVLLCPQNVQNEQKEELLVCSSLSPVVILDPHDGAVVMEVAANMFTYDYSPDFFEIWLSREVLKSMKRIVQANIPFTEKKKDAAMNKTWFTEEDFSNGNKGAIKNIQRYMDHMKRDYETHIQPLEDSDGVIKLPPKISTTWSELLARSGSYFKKFNKQHDHFKLMGKDKQALSYLGFTFLPRFERVRGCEGRRREAVLSVLSFFLLLQDFVRNYGTVWNITICNHCP